MIKPPRNCLTSFTRIPKPRYSNFIKCYSNEAPASSATNNMSIALKQQLYMIDSNSPGSVFFLPHGTRLFNKLVQFMKIQQKKHGFDEVITPLIYKKKLWEISGHWDNYKEDMYRVEGNEVSHGDAKDEETFGLKPMNCPGHCLIYKRFDRSINELPIRYSDWSSLHRNEASGALTGLTRVRRFHQDDGHIFCTQEQISAEIMKTLHLIKLVYGVFGLSDYTLMLSTRPDNYVGTLEEWNSAESQLKSVLDQVAPLSWSIREGDGAFYGPKIDILSRDNYSREHQIGTIQLDFQLPHRFELKYRPHEGDFKPPIMIHRAVFGSIERFMALLIDHYQGKWPFWMNPRQAVIIPINSSHLEKANEVRGLLSGRSNDYETLDDLVDHQFDIDIDSRAETVGYRTRDALNKSYSYIILVGDKELENNVISLRSRDSRKVSTKTVEEVRELFQELVRSYQ
ncbi:hypothetical protein LJB42_004612 [Komagataella kurtzmanii]|nr:hypothetical protein LJB42_004612 [Komagataella kurtzmanii]